MSFLKGKGDCWAFISVDQYHLCIISPDQGKEIVSMHVFPLPRTWVPKYNLNSFKSPMLKITNGAQNALYSLAPVSPIFKLVILFRAQHINSIHTQFLSPLFSYFQMQKGDRASSKRGKGEKQVFCTFRLNT